MNAILLIAHTPLASALRAGALHVFPDAADAVAALDVLPAAAPEDTLARARAALAALPAGQGVLVLGDVCGATPCNVAQRLGDDTRTQLLAGVNLPMLLRAISYRHEPLDDMARKALDGGVRGIVTMDACPPTPPQQQPSQPPPDSASAAS
jgi:PTS system ascorbate-specific IIA component